MARVIGGVVIPQSNDYHMFNPSIGSELVIDNVDRYTLLDRLGEGGDGLSYSARDSSGNLRAVKIRNYDSSDIATDRYERLREKFLRLDGVNVGIHYEAHKISASQVAVIGNYIDGNNLEESRRLHTEREVVDGLVQLVGDYIEPLHTGGILHGDINPRNLIRTPDGRIVPIDFSDSKRTGTQTLTTTYRGTFGYALDFGEVTPQYDFYSLGQVAMFLATGEHPEYISVPKYKDLHNSDRIKNLDVSDGLKNILRKLTIDRSYSSAGSLIRDLRGLNGLERVVEKETAIDRFDYRKELIESILVTGMSSFCVLVGIGCAALSTLSYLYSAPGYGSLYGILTACFGGLGYAFSRRSYFSAKSLKEKRQRVLTENSEKEQGRRQIASLAQPERQWGHWDSKAVQVRIEEGRPAWSHWADKSLETGDSSNTKNPSMPEVEFVDLEEFIKK